MKANWSGSSQRQTSKLTMVSFQEKVWQLPEFQIGICRVKSGVKYWYQSQNLHFWKFWVLKKFCDKCSRRRIHKNFNTAIRNKHSYLGFKAFLSIIFHTIDLEKKVYPQKSPLFFFGGGRAIFLEVVRPFFETLMILILKSPNY